MSKTIKWSLLHWWSLGDHSTWDLKDNSSSEWYIKGTVAWDGFLSQSIPYNLDSKNLIFFFNLYYYLLWIARFSLTKRCRRMRQEHLSAFSFSATVYNLTLPSLKWYDHIEIKATYQLRNWVGIGLSYRPAMLHTQPGGIGSLESILGLKKSLQIRALRASTSNRGVIPVRRQDGNRFLGLQIRAQ